MNTVIIRPRFSGIQKKSDLGAGCGVNKGLLPPFGAGKDYFFIIFMINWTAFAVGVVVLWMQLNWTN